MAHVAGQNFAFESDRDAHGIVDCRIPTFDNRAKWKRCELSAKDDAAVTSFMQITGYSFGRLDFLRDASGLWFLEVNPNGQFAWLDIEGKEVPLQAVANEIIVVHRRLVPTS